ncbi:MAG: DUF3473 domain-containing protein [FCB group bacterium]|nr:DUF3473 domain-containing protein [FCB group bacterium]
MAGKKNSQEKRQQVSNILSIDWEDYYHATGFADAAPYHRWDRFASRIEFSLDMILEALENQSATFFILGWEAEQRPQLIKRISDAGHEIATHGRYHRLLTSMTPEEFRNDIESCKKRLEDITGKPVLGHRAPSFSITGENEWVFEELAKQGFKYDSSVYPVKRSRGGMEGTSFYPHKVATSAGSIREFPLATVKIAGKRIPAAGGGFFRMYPYILTKYAITRNNAAGIPVVVYLHPWEFDYLQPRLKSIFTSNGFKHYVNIRRNFRKFTKLLRDFEFISFRDYLECSPEHDSGLD